jgi:hypothetical protein
MKMKRKRNHGSYPIFCYPISLYFSWKKESMCGSGENENDKEDEKKLTIEILLHFY